MAPKKFYLTTPIYYVNARPHIGHAYTTIVGDVLARRHRLLGDETWFLTGTDEHGQKIERSAAAAGIPPQQFADQVSASFETLWRRMGITHNDYIRTTEPRHIAGAQKLFAELYARGFIYLASYTGSYCVSDEAFIDAPVGTPCLDCGRLLEEVTEENFFFKLSAFQEQLIDLIESNQLVITPEAARNEVLSFIRGNWTAELAQHFPTAKQQLRELNLWDDGVNPTVEEMAQYIGSADSGLHGRAKKSKLGYYLPGALKDLSISRSSFTWGIPVPEPAASAAAQKHVIYVWLDALANYMTALGYGSEDTTLFDKFWPADLHLVGKEITRFHCVYWPAFLLAAGLPTPKQITANGWLLFDNSKMSKSKGNIVRTETILDAFGTLCPPPAAPSPSLLSFRSEAEESASPGPPPSPTEPTPSDRDLFAADILRYYLLREIPFGQDGSFSFEALITRYNADLANGYGNLVSRTLTMLEKYCDSTIPLIGDRSDWDERLWMDHAFGKSPGMVAWSDPNKAFDPKSLREFGMYQTIEHSVTTRELMKGEFGNVGFQAQLAEIALAIRMTDGFISSEAPWKLAKDPDAEAGLKEVLYTAAESIRIITALLYPILPYATARVWAQLGLGDIELAARNGELTNLQWGGLQPGTKLGPLGPIFPRAPKELAQIMTDMENPTPTTELSSRPERSAVERPAVESSTTAPDAPPRAFDAPSEALPVAGSHAHTTGPDPSLPKGEPAPAAPAETTPQITIDDFAKIELRVAQITLAERIPKADKLLRLEVDLGPFGTRQILSGIAEHYTPEELTGRRIVVITNLAPRKMRGLESHGMLLAASEGEHGKPYLATCGEEIALGSRLK